MNTTNQILDQVTALLTRVRARAIGLEEVGHVLESIVFNLRQLANRPSCSGSEAQWIAKQYGVIPTRKSQMLQAGKSEDEINAEIERRTQQ